MVVDYYSSLTYECLVFRLDDRKNFQFSKRGIGIESESMQTELELELELIFFSDLELELELEL